MRDNKLIAIDLFCGCGGFSYGFQQAGFEMALGIDMWKDATITYVINNIHQKQVDKKIDIVPLTYRIDFGKDAIDQIVIGEMKSDV